MSDKQQENKPAGHQDEQSDKESINKPSGWAKVQNEWAQEKLDIAQARADKFFAVDDELPLRKHLLLSFIAIFFVLFIYDSSHFFHHFHYLFFCTNSMMQPISYVLRRYSKCCSIFH